MSPSAEPVPAVELLDVSEELLEQLLELALRDADADEVTPPLGTTAGWNTDRISWFREFHRAAAAGLDGPAGQKTWAIRCDGQLAGSIRLKRMDAEPAEAGDGAAGGAGAGGGGAGAGGGGALETGIWLARSFRGRGVGREALRLVKARAASAGAAVLVAETTAGNVGALALLKYAGAELVTGAPSETETVPVIGKIPLR
ncbi:GNAT family N-acetyltransferase [Arthrobacter sp. 9MFCol3.1]|uniref:GNAT family N-acetyltransferase n=1 Tax=Arthrobacter sp. 9MFCol3.1 TaxID=1150398 RepID=UPI00047A70E5|nr:GNAT family N-acetyltransferase [Arthrobacter sp. 9MFCol3.1]